MVIKEKKVLSMIEVKEIVETVNKENEIIPYIKKFNKIAKTEAKKLREKLEGLNNLKIKSEHIAKIIDLLPEDISDINKIFVETSLNEEESKKILEIVKEFI